MALNRKIAFINLNSNAIDIQPIPNEWRRKFLGGRGLNAYLAVKQISPGCDPLAPENAVIIGAGLLGGTLIAPFECTQIVTKSPLTQLLGRATLSGFFASEMRWAGYDHLVVKGRARNPVYIWIHNGNIQIRNARHIWGKGVFESRDLLNKELGDENIRTISIGPAGENRVRYGNITGDRNQISGRTGMGAVLGSKNVKAIVCRGEMDIQIKHPGAALSYQKEFLDMALSRRRSLSGLETTAREDESARNIKLLAESGPRFENAFYPDHNLVADLGLDPLATECMVRWAGALYDKKIITPKDTGGLQLWPGDPQTLQDMITQIAVREGFGDILAQGPVPAARKIGTGSLNLFTPPTRLIRMLSEDTFDPVPHAVTPKAHRYSNVAKHHFTTDHKHLPEKDAERYGQTGDRTADLPEACQEQFTGSAGKILWLELYEMLSQCLGLCVAQIPCLKADPKDISLFKKMIALNTGLTISEKDLQDAAYRCYAIERLFNLRESAVSMQKQGREHELDFPFDLHLPQKLLNNFDLKKVRRLVNDHYRLNGWDKAAVLKLKILKELKLSDLWPLVKPKGDR